MGPSKGKVRLCLCPEFLEQIEIEMFWEDLIAYVPLIHNQYVPGIYSECRKFERF
jgi:hypothetical protein